MTNRDPFSTPPSPAPDDPVDSSSGISPGDEAGLTGGKLQRKADEMTGKAQDKASEMSDQAQDKASEMSGKAQDKADQGMDAAASGLGQAADKVREQGEQREGAVGVAATRTADTLDTASQYLKDKDTAQIMNDLEAFVRRKPVESLLIAAGIGIVLSKIVR